MTLTAADIQGADLSEPLVLFGIPVQKVPGKHSQQRPLAALIHPKHATPSCSPVSITWKLVEGGTRILAWVVVTTHYICPGVLRRSQSYLNRFSLFAYRH